MLTTHRPIPSVRVLGVRYWDGRPAPGDGCALDAYVSAAVYWDAGLPVAYEEPRLPEALLTGAEEEDLGRVCGSLALAVAAGRRAGGAVLITGGNCSHAVGVLGGLQAAHGPAARIGIVWLDAHGDFNTPNTTLTGRLWGMPLAVCAGLGLPRWRELGGVLAPVPTDRIVLVDARNLDPAEAALVQASGVTVAAATPGRPGAPLDEALARLAAGCDLIYLHVDADILDLELLPSARTGEPGGVTLAEAHHVIAMTLATGKVAAAAVVAVFNEGPGGPTSVASGLSLIGATLAAWRRHGMAG